MLSAEFLEEFKSATEAKWCSASIDPTIYGFQFRPGTRWNPGLAEELIAEYERALQVQFPHDFRAFLHAMNGTDLATVNIYGSCGEPHRESVGVYSYPKDLEVVKRRIEDIHLNRAEITADLAEQGFELSAEAGLVPIFSDRYVFCTSNLDSCVVLSIVVNGVDAIVYGDSLREYLEKDFPLD